MFRFDAVRLAGCRSFPPDPRTRTLGRGGRTAGWILALLLPLPLTAGVNRWTSHGPDAGEVWSIAFSASSPSTVFVSSQGAGIYRSDDSGAHWRALPYSTSDGGVGSLAVDPTNSSIVYAGTFGNGVFKSTDGGHSWTRSPQQASTVYGKNISALAIDPTNVDVVYAATLDGVWKSLDGGCSWGPMNVGLPVSNDILYTQAIAIDPSNPSVLYLGTSSNGAYRSADGAASWSPASTGLAYPAVGSIAIDPSNSNRVFVTNLFYFGDVGGGAGTVAVSQDAGQSWQPAGTGLPSALYGGVVLDPATPSRLWATVSGTGVVRSLDGGATWAGASAGLDDPTVGVLALLPGSAPRLFVAAGFAGLAKSDDGGDSWQPSRAGLRIALWSALAVAPSAPDVVFAGGRGNVGGLAKTADSGQTWQGSGSGLVDEGQVLALAIDPADASVVYAAQDLTSTPGTFKSTDGGASWSAPQNGPNDFMRALAIDPADSLHVFAGGEGNIYHSTDGGASWLPAAPPLPYPAPIIAGGGGLVTALSYVAELQSSRPFVSTDGGDTWTIADAGLPAVAIWTLASDPSNASVLYAATIGGGLFRTADGGGSWSAVAGDLSAYALTSVAVDPSDPADLFVGTQTYLAYPSTDLPTGGVLRSRDGGVTWNPVTTGLDDPASREILALAAAPGGPVLHAATQAGVFDIQLSDVPGPLPTSVSPVSGPRAGGTTVTVFGSAFQPGAQVFVGGAPATSVNVVDAGTISLTTPARSSGAADVVVQNPDGQLETLVRAFAFDFDDVLPGADYYGDVMRLTLAGAAVGCGQGLFCPDAAITRSQMAVLLERTLHGPEFVYPPPTASFADVMPCSPEGKYILQMADEALTVGCGPDHFCPDAGNTRAQAAVFAIKAEHGLGYVPPPATGTMFTDVPADAFAADYIEQLAGEGITAGCGGGLFCPDADVTRAQSAVFLSRALLAP